MARLALSVAVGDYDRTRPLIDGTVRIDGVEPTIMTLTPEEIFFRAFRDAPFDVCELSLSSFTVKAAAGDGAYVGVPAFVSRAFRHTSIYVRKDRIRGPQDLKGGRIGVAEYQLTANVWARAILAAHGVAPEHLFKVPYFVTSAAPRRTPEERFQRKQLLFLGRGTNLKGWPELLRAFALFSPAHPGWTLTVVGEGPDLQDLRTAAETLGLPVIVHSWQDETERNALLDGCTVLVLPSTWPEPFGIVGIEAAGLGIPTATFGTGGIGEWLTPGENGEVAASMTSSALADALGRAVSSLEHYRDLSRCAAKRARDFGIERHLLSLARIFSSLVGSTTGDVHRSGRE